MYSIKDLVLTIYSMAYEDLSASCGVEALAVASALANQHLSVDKAQKLGILSPDAALHVEYLVRHWKVIGGRGIGKLRVAPPKAAKDKYTFIDLFAGIGGFRQALSKHARCVFTSEWDAAAKETYFQNYGEVPFGDITQLTAKTGHPILSQLVPDHDILCGGWPCQPFSNAGKGLGFADTRGTLFFDLLEIVKSHRPAVLFLENVKRLKTHDGGKTFAVVCAALLAGQYTV